MNAIAAMARACARANLPLADARRLFEAAYDADCLLLAKGNRKAAAEISGQGRAALIKRRAKSQVAK